MENSAANSVRKIKIVNKLSVLGWLFLFMSLSTAALVLLLYFSFHMKTRTISFAKSATAPTPAVGKTKPSPGIPVRLTISAIAIDAAIQPLGVTTMGDMDTPTDFTQVGWFNLGSRPGEKGSAVLDGHFDGPNGEPGIFANLEKLQTGDTITVTDEYGAVRSFTVRESRTYSPGYAEEVFRTNDSSHLNLITCFGDWDANKNSFTKRLVVFADIAN